MDGGCLTGITKQTKKNLLVANKQNRFSQVLRDDVIIFNTPLALDSE